MFDEPRVLFLAVNSSYLTGCVGNVVGPDASGEEAGYFAEIEDTTFAVQERR